MRNMTVVFHQYSKNILLGLILIIGVNLINSTEQPFNTSTTACYEYRLRRSWWTYSWCYKESLQQYRVPRVGKPPVELHHIGDYKEELSVHRFHQFFENVQAECIPDGYDTPIKRTGEVFIKCCQHDLDEIKIQRKAERKNGPTFIDTVIETKPCHYVYSVCAVSACMDDETSPESQKNLDKGLEYQSNPTPKDIPVEEVADDKQKDNEDVADPTDNVDEEIVIVSQKPHPKKKIAVITRAEQLRLKEKVREMFYHGYDAYMKYAFPESDLRPISCTGQRFELIKIPLVTLIDTLDTLVIMGNYSEFKHAVRLISEEIPSFSFDTSVSVFETTIRILGGLLSAHLFAIDPLLKIYSGEQYDGNLLRLAIDIGNRLLPAFRTTTGIPYGTVNLMKGVPKGETELASTAGAGSLLLEFEVLSCLSGDPKYGLAAMKAVEQLYHSRSDLDLVGKHIHIRTGKWHETLSGVGSNSDSFYEYLLKSYLLFRKIDHYRMFQDVYYAVKKHSMAGDWFVDVDMYSGKVRNKRSENLQAFWPGMEALLGMSDASGRLLNAFYLVWSEVGFLPEEFDYVNWASNGHKGFVSLLYPLRPELIESTYFHYRTTGDRSWLLAGKDFLESFEKYSRTDCGYATVKDVTKRTLEDNMPSFFLSETCKYLYLLYDEDNFIHSRRDYIFTTEAHPIDPVQLSDTCSYHLDQPDSQIHHDSNTGEDNQSWGDSLLGRVFSTLTGGSSDSDDAESSQDDVEITIEDEDHDSDINELDPSDTNLEEKRQKESDVYIDWLFGKDLHPHYLQCPKPQWWNILSYRPGVSVSSDVLPPQPLPQQEDNRQQFLDLSEFLKLMTQQPYVDPFDPNTICGVDDDLKASNDRKQNNAGKGLSSNAQKVTMERSIEVEVGVMGKFIVNIFPDGFVINSVKSGNTIEIAGVGTPSIFVKEYNSTTSSTVISTNSILSTCNVRLHVDWPSEIWRKKAYNKRDFSPEELTKNRCCSHAAFGPTSDLESFPKQPLYYTATRALDGTCCQTPRTQKTEDESPPEPTTQPTSSSSWFNWGKKKSKHGRNGQLYAGNVVIADRGGCMFEEKVIQAEASGATGVIVVNSEPTLFMMSGIKSMDLKTDSDSDRQMAGKTSIPAVMLTNHDGRFVLDAIEYLGNFQITPQVVIDLQSFPSIFDSRIMGYGSGHPSIRVSDNVVHVVGQSEWSVILTKTESNEWQLYIVPSSNLQSFVPWTIITSNNLPVSTNPTFSWNTNPVGIYHQIISEQCPVDIEWNQKVILRVS